MARDPAAAVTGIVNIYIQNGKYKKGSKSD